MLNGGKRAQAEDVIAHSDHAAGEPAIALAAGKVTIGRGAVGAPATVWLVRYDPRTLQVPIRAGENGGRTLPHRNIVRSIEAIGTWSGAPAAYAVTHAADPVYRSAVLVQRGKGGPIVAAGRI